MEVETLRLKIRDLTQEDWRDVHQYASNPDVTKYMIWGPNSEAETKAYIDEQLSKQSDEPRTDFELGVVLKETNTLIGGCGMYINDHNAEIGYCFNPDYWGKGYATEAAQAMVKLAFERFNIHRIFATCRPDNIPSANVLKRTGMKQEGHLREHLFSKGRFHDSYLFSILEHEYGEMKGEK